MKKNLKRVAVRVAGVVGLVVLCMAAYYGVSMFLLQNGMQNMSSMFCSMVCVVFACIAMSADRKQKSENVAGADV